MNKILFIGGDTRQKIAAEYLRKEKFETEEFIDSAPKNLDFSRFDAVVLPLPTTRDGININTPLLEEKILIEDVVKNLEKYQLLFTGSYTPSHKFYTDLTLDEEFSFLNAIPTAEGAIKILIDSTDTTLWNSKILIVGNGKIGKILASRLSSFGARITVSARKSYDFSYVEAFGFEKADSNDLEKIIGDYDIVINTVPYPLIGKKHILNSKENCLFLELSSAPFGIDKDAVIGEGRNYVYAPSLPGKTAPKTAGIFLGKTIEKLFYKLVGSDCFNG